VLCAAGFNIRWLLRAIARQAAKAISLVFDFAALYVATAVLALVRLLRRSERADEMGIVNSASETRSLLGLSVGLAIR